MSTSMSFTCGSARREARTRGERLHDPRNRRHRGDLLRVRRAVDDGAGLFVPEPVRHVHEDLVVEASRASMHGPCRWLNRRLSADVALDGLLVADGRVVGIQPRRPPGATLAEEVPALVERDLETFQALLVRRGRLPA